MGHQNALTFSHWKGGREGQRMLLGPHVCTSPLCSPASHSSCPPSVPSQQRQGIPSTLTRLSLCHWVTFGISFSFPISSLNNEKPVEGERAGYFCSQIFWFIKTLSEHRSSLRTSLELSSQLPWAFIVTDKDLERVSYYSRKSSPMEVGNLDCMSNRTAARV